MWLLDHFQSGQTTRRPALRAQELTRKKATAQGKQAYEGKYLS